MAPAAAARPTWACTDDTSWRAEQLLDPIAVGQRGRRRRHAALGDRVHRRIVVRRSLRRCTGSASCSTSVCFPGRCRARRRCDVERTAVTAAIAPHRRPLLCRESLTACCQV